ncbi:hypothetical protein [Neobacillus thermocopriae]|uniref:Uncharacterized protein n=1 Tax=Neobacillus thermocopriae TaxID=1215031 RepID=A0A6B3TLD8_9BACI|nr:hypothetical protein [Neobacillus thermocopriae]MED3713634.1 hypothetical protein [Neobacillus thermocopriae]NEX77744.1 hypothetical protein [Neobacillus thermocopriae]
MEKNPSLSYYVYSPFIHFIKKFFEFAGDGTKDSLRRELVYFEISYYFDQ